MMDCDWWTCFATIVEMSFISSTILLLNLFVCLCCKHATVIYNGEIKNIYIYI